MKKTMMLFVMAVLGSIGSSAMAAEATVQAVKTHNSFDFTVNGRTAFGHQVYYNCDAAEDYIENLLGKMGATNISVRCTGGIDMGQIPMDMLAIEVAFDSVRMPSAAVTGTETAGVWKEVKLHDFGNCNLAMETIKGVKDHFDLKDIKGLDRCWDANDSYRVSFSALMAN
ncbi:MAG: hypothetical protein ACJ763_16360 [Bdellovibrionia bacterium]